MTPRDEQIRLTVLAQHAAVFIDENERLLSSLRLLLEAPSPGRHPNHTYAETLRLIARIRDTADLASSNMALMGRQQPGLSLRTLADALGISINTLRRRLDALAQDVPESPFPSRGVDDG